MNKLVRGHLYFADKEGHVTKAKLKSDLAAKQNLTETVLIRIAPADRELLDAVTAHRCSCGREVITSTRAMV